VNGLLGFEERALRLGPWALVVTSGAALVLGTALLLPASPRLLPSRPAAVASAAAHPERVCPPPRGGVSVGASRALARVAAGTVRPFYKGASREMAVPSFLLEVEPVSRGAFLEFVSCRPEWRRSAVFGVHAEAGYLGDWHGDRDPGDAPLSDPVTAASWFAARAYCESVGRRLPTTVEWERALGLGSVAPGATARPGAIAPAERFAFAMGRPAEGAGAMFSAGKLWEWTEDFNATPVSSSGSLSQFCGDGVRSSDPSDYGAFLRFSFRSSLKASYALKNLTFRCAKDGAP
jgi:formylglycine-generating enzyme required for sulfatase activity